jgi:hypothetical protein
MASVVQQEQRMSSWLATVLRPRWWDDEQEASVHAWHAQLSEDAAERLHCMARVRTAEAKKWMRPGGADFLCNHFIVAEDIRAERTARLRSVGDPTTLQGTQGKRNAIKSLVDRGWMRMLSDEMPHHLGLTFRYVVEVDEIASIELFPVEDPEGWDKEGDLTAAIPFRLWSARYPGVPCRDVDAVIAEYKGTPHILPPEKPIDRMVEVE